VLAFPQLVTGASAIYPVNKKRVQRTVVNTLGDGRTVVFEDADASSLEWEIRVRGLTHAEASAFETLFDAVSGGWKTFTFLDPAGNLLAHSEEFGASVWSNGPLIQLTSGIADPLGTTRATQVVNAGQAAQAVAQTLAVPASFQYCLSVWARSTGGASVTLMVSASGGSAQKTFALTAQWTRVTLAGNLGASSNAVTFAAQLAAGAAVDLFGMQAEAQPGASDYKRTGAAGGVRANARFAADELRVTAQGTDVYDAVIHIVSAGD
jgi:hypothetical protein